MLKSDLAAAAVYTHVWLTVDELTARNIVPLCIHALWSRAPRATKAVDCAAISLLMSRKTKTNKFII